MARIFEINKILLTLNNYSRSTGVIKEILLDELIKVALMGETSKYEEKIRGCEKLGFIERNNNVYLLTVTGKHFLDLISIKDGKAILDPNDFQKKFLIELLPNTEYKADLEKIFESFRIDYSKRDKIWFSPFPFSNLGDKNLVDILLDSGFFHPENSRIEIPSNYSDIVSQFKNKTQTSEVDFFLTLENQRKTGNTAEELTVEYEKKRLIEQGYIDLSLAVQRISQVDIFAGYDILSFNGKNSTYSHDRRIEVKSTSSSSPYFYWSDNEISKAKEHGNEYWIYLWTNIRPSGSQKLFCIQNPYENLILQGLVKPKPVSYIIELSENASKYEI